MVPLVVKLYLETHKMFGIQDLDWPSIKVRKWRYRGCVVIYLRPGSWHDQLPDRSFLRESSSTLPDQANHSNVTYVLKKKRGKVTLKIHTGSPIHITNRAHSRTLLLVTSQEKLKKTLPLEAMKGTLRPALATHPQKKGEENSKTKPETLNPNF